jgi:hypothetical protein
MAPAEPGAVKSPLALIAPPVADQVTAESGFPVLVSVALHCDVVFTITIGGLHVTSIEPPPADCTVIKVLPDLLVSCVLVAVTFTDPALLGAVKAPLELILPLVADHVTVGL